MTARPIRIFSTGGTIGMTGVIAEPELGAADLVRDLPGLDAFGEVTSVTLLNKPSPQLTLADQLMIARAARDAAREGAGVVVTHGTDTLEETAMLCDIVHDSSSPVVFTGAIRSASAAGADGPANLIDAVSVAASTAATGLGVLVVFGGEIHHARCARKTDTISLVPFTSPQTGPLGRVTEGHPTIWSQVPRNAPLDPPNLDRHVPIVPSMAGDDGTLARAVLATEPDGVVVGTLGAGHLTPEVLRIWAAAAAEVPVIAYSRPERGVVLTSTYGYEGSERDLRDTPIIPAGFLSAQAIRMKLLACVATGLTIPEIRQAFRQDDA